MARLITTYDNPYSPVDNFKEWFKWDESAGYHTCSWLARLCKVPTEMGPFTIDAVSDAAVDELVSMFPTIYKAVDDP